MVLCKCALRKRAAERVRCCVTQSINKLQGTLPSCLSSLTALTLLDVSRNALSGVLPVELAQMPLAAGMGVSLFDNLFSGTVPPEYSSLSWVALAYNPLLVGALPSGFTVAGATAKLRTWSGYYNHHAFAFARPRRCWK